MKAILLLAASLAGGCGGGFADADVKSATDAARAELQIETICAGEGKACAPSQVRALERMAYCSNASMLAHHGKPVPQATPPIACSP